MRRHSRMFLPAFILSIFLLVPALGPVSPAFADDPDDQQVDLVPAPNDDPAEPVGQGEQPANTDPQTVSADPLPTAQIGTGVVWDQVVVGDTVYVAGQFSTARPAGAAEGDGSDVSRSNLMAYKLSTGELLGWAPTTNGPVSSIDASPDGSTIYIGGRFDKLNDVPTYRVGAVSAADGSRQNLRLGTNAKVVSVAVSPDGNTLYIGGGFSEVNKQRRLRAAAFDLNTQTLKDFSVGINDYQVQTIAVSPDSGSVALGGSFTSVDGSTNPGYGLAIFDANGQLRNNAINSVVRNAGASASVFSLVSDSKGLYGTGYSVGTGTIEGVFRANWDTGNLDYLADCHGDSYDIFPQGDVAYISSHTHDCSNIGGMPNSTSTFHNATAITNYPTGTVRPNNAKYYVDNAGNPAPTSLNFYPKFTGGTFTKLNQETWTVEGNDDYVVYGGEFTTINDTNSQQGLVRFAKRDIAPNKIGPEVKGGAYSVTAQSVNSGVVSLSFRANWDRDDKTLTYKVYRDSAKGEPVSTQTVAAGFWELPDLTATDTVKPGTTHQYQVVAEDPWGATAKSDWVTVTAAGEAEPELSPLGQQVLADGANGYWPLDETEGATATDAVGGATLTVNGQNYTRGDESVTKEGASLKLTSTKQATSFGATTTEIQGPSTFSEEAWFRTTSSSGGEIVGFGASSDSESKDKDRIIYMRDDGTLGYMLYPGSVTTLVSPSAYNDGQWHHVVATTDVNSGSALYVDGSTVASDPAMTTAQRYNGYWHVGGDSLEGLDSAPSSGYFNGSVDEVAVYATSLDAAKVANHYTLVTGKDPVPPKDGGNGQDVGVGQDFIADGFDRDGNNGWGTADKGGAWSVDWGKGNFSTSSSQGWVAMNGARSTSSIHSQVVKSTSTDSQVDFSLDKLATGNGAYITYTGRQTASGRYQAETRVAADGKVTVSVSKTHVSTGTTVLGMIDAGTYQAGQPIHLRLVLDGAQATTVRANAWIGDAAQPANWQVDTVDDDAVLSEPGSVGFMTYMSASAGSETVNAKVETIRVTRLS